MLPQTGRFRLFRKVYFVGLFSKLFRQNRSYQISDPLLQALVKRDDITKEQALAIPSVAECVDTISGIIAALPIKLYRDKGTESEEILEDARLFLLNDETGDLMDSYQAKKAWVTDYLLDGQGYIVIQ